LFSRRCRPQAFNDAAAEAGAGVLFGLDGTLDLLGDGPPGASFIQVRAAAVWFVGIDAVAVVSVVCLGLRLVRHA
jgi:hypothetical protein